MHIHRHCFNEFFFKFKRMPFGCMKSEDIPKSVEALNKKVPKKGSNDTSVGSTIELMRLAKADGKKPRLCGEPLFRNTRKAISCLAKENSLRRRVFNQNSK